uniref:Secreted protein n=1 Tax=Angiostrongylus cantonensis TaxID=6313 RepID=A0A158P6Z4_ANGCA
LPRMWRRSFLLCFIAFVQFVESGAGDTEIEFSTDDECKKPVEMVTADNKKKLNEEIHQKFGGFKSNMKSYSEQTAEHKTELNEEIKEKFGEFKENCFPKPSGGCKCNEKDVEGNEVVTAYNNVAECRISRVTRDVGVAVQRQPVNTNVYQQKVRGRDYPSQNVRDPVRERAQENYRAVLNELNMKFKGLKEGCFPRPKGCLCVVGKTPEGRDITERRVKDSDCKCKEGEKGCPTS